MKSDWSAFLIRPHLLSHDNPAPATSPCLSLVLPGWCLRLARNLPPPLRKARPNYGVPKTRRHFLPELAGSGPFSGLFSAFHPPRGRPARAPTSHPHPSRLSMSAKRFSCFSMLTILPHSSRSFRFLVCPIVQNHPLIPPRLRASA